MKKTTKFTSILVGLSIVFSACDNNNSTIIPSANVTTQEKFITDYNGVEISSAFVVDIEYSATEESIIIEASENLHQYIEVEKVNDKLRIKIRDNTNFSGSATLRAHIITKNYLKSISATEASQITLVNAQESAEVNIYMTDASLLIGTINTNLLTAFIDGAANATLSGSADTFTLNGASASVIGTFDMIINYADIQLDGASSASLTVNGTIDLIASGASVLMYKGTAQINNLELSEGSQIVKAD
jgi:hypothetical protein